MELRMLAAQQMRLQLTQKLRQSIDILQMSSLELMEYVKEQTADNPLIESISGEPRVRTGGRKKSAAEHDSDWWLNVHADTEKSLEEALLEQLKWQNLDKQTYLYCLMLIRSLNDNGYLDGTPEELAGHIGAPLQELRRALRIVQSMEPSGVGATSLEECLLLQLAENDPQNALARALVARDLQNVANKKFALLAKKYAVDTAAIQKAVDRIGRLNPKPGLAYGKGKPEYVVPDVVIQNVEGRFEVVLDDRAAPALSWNLFYLNMIKQTDCKETSSYLRQKWTAAKWLSKCIEQRKATLHHVAKAMFDIQRDFCEHGPASIKPMSLKDIAGVLNVHESTVSRAVRGKYALTPWGTYELRHFFSASIPQCGDEAASALQIKEQIRDIVAKEDKTNPLSDQNIAELLQEKGCMISRRTVAKYRESMNIGSSAKRKRYEV
ncbi:RNA polymerase factor sigma-54 [Paenibacillus hamazuiensis]|uniref:RNA polymerase factor sigma-54 n=1 Tax=Paenibacillus hamazuiensis TaxID=2936508 RepID=UPI00200E6EDB|nr:RNA polymerase factor sigma-54 [Paenibacillus hamazuiensis]